MSRQDVEDIKTILRFIARTIVRHTHRVGRAIHEFCKAPETKVKHIPVKTVGLETSKYHLIVRRVRQS